MEAKKIFSGFIFLGVITFLIVLSVGHFCPSDFKNLFGNINVWEASLYSGIGIMILNLPLFFSLITDTGK